MAAVLAGVATWLFASRDERAGKALRYRQAAERLEAKHGVDSERATAANRKCEQGFAVVARELERVGAGDVWHRSADSIMVVFDTPGEIAALARTAGVPASSLAPGLSVSLEACQSMRTRLPQVRSGKHVYVRSIRTRFRYATDYADQPIAIAPTVPDQHFPTWQRQRRSRAEPFVTFYASEHRSFIALARESVSSHGDRFVYADVSWPVGLRVMRLGFAIESMLIVHGSGEAPDALPFADRSAGALAPWLDRLDALSVAEATGERNNKSRSG